MAFIAQRRITLRPPGLDVFGVKIKLVNLKELCCRSTNVALFLPHTLTPHRAGVHCNRHGTRLVTASQPILADIWPLMDTQREPCCCGRLARSVWLRCSLTRGNIQQSRVSPLQKPYKTPAHLISIMLISHSGVNVTQEPKQIGKEEWRVYAATSSFWLLLFWLCLESTFMPCLQT